jgi:putative nucleotidyltransferase-like protein
VSAGALVLAALYLEPSAARAARLRAAGERCDDWGQALAALEAHGIVGLAARNLAEAGAPVPAAAARTLAERAEAMRTRALAFGLILERFLEEAARGGLEVTLLKGAALAQDLYPQGGLRAQGDLDVLVATEDVPAAIEAALRSGLEPPRDSLPTWWHRLAHFHLKLESAGPLPGELELHWHLHPPSAPYAVSLAALRERRRALQLGALRAWTLDPLDRLLHLVTHLARHQEPWAADRARLVAWAADPRAPLRLKWVLDLAAEIERRHAELDPLALARRADEWNAGDELARTLLWLRAELELEPPAEAWVARALAALPEPPAARARLRRASHAPLAGLDLRAEALADLPRWLWPPRACLSKRGVTRMGHVLLVLARLARAGVLLPFAWLLRTSGRNPPTPLELTPEQVLALAQRARERERGEPAAPTSS